MANKWIAHVKKTMKAMKSKGTYKKGMGLKQVIKEAKKNWHSAKKGGADEPVAALPVDTESSSEEEQSMGGRRRRNKKTQRRRKH
jgi:hypothetical protein